MAELGTIGFTSRFNARFRSAGTLAARPASPDGVGDTYLATDQTPALISVSVSGTTWDYFVYGIKDNYAATTAPGTSDDSADGYSVGSIWIDVTNDNSYVCVDASAGAAVWVQTNGGGGATQLDELSDVSAAASTANYVLATPNGSTGSYSGRALVGADLPVMVGDSGSGGTKGAVPAPAAGDAGAGKFLKADGSWATPSGSPDVSVKAYKSGSANQNVTSGSTVTISFDAELFDTSSMHDNVSNNERITIPETGKYLIGVNLGIDLSSVVTNPTIEVMLLVDGLSAPFFSQAIKADVTHGIALWGITYTTLMNLTSGQYVYCRVKNWGGDTFTVKGDNFLQYSTFWAVKQL